jgi:hypothetical protein
MFGIFKSKVSHRAGERSFKAFEAAWFGSPFPDYVNNSVPIWERQYQETLERCNHEDPVDVLNSLIDSIMHLFIAAHEKAKSMVQRTDVDEKDAYTMSGSFTILGLMSQIVFAHAPAFAHFNRIDPDRVCFDTITCIKESVEARRTEVRSEYADSANVILSLFLSSLFGDS